MQTAHQQLSKYLNIHFFIIKTDYKDRNNYDLKCNKNMKDKEKKKQKNKKTKKTGAVVFTFN